MYSQRAPVNFEKVVEADDCGNFCYKEITRKFICHKENKLCIDIVQPLCIRGCIVHIKYNFSGQMNIYQANMLKLKMYLNRKKSY